MNKKRYSLFCLLVIIILITSLLIIKVDTNKPKEYLNIVSTVYNENNPESEVSMVLYSYSISDDSMKKLIEVPIKATYPIAITDYKNEKVYYSNSEEVYEPDNLYEYDLKTDTIKQLTFGKFLFNDLLILDDKLYANVARRGANVTQPAIFDKKTNEFTYLNKNDDDTWCFSLSYNYSLDKLISLTTSDSEMRSEKVRFETHIRPKTIYSMNLDFKNYEPIYFTDKYEVCLTRQIDDDRILITFDEMMGSEKPRKLKMLYLDSGKEEILDIDGLSEIKSFYPRDNGEGVFILGRSPKLKYELFYYDFKTKGLKNIFENYDLPENHMGFVDFVYTIQ